MSNRSTIKRSKGEKGAEKVFKEMMIMKTIKLQIKDTTYTLIRINTELFMPRHLE